MFQDVACIATLFALFLSDMIFDPHGGVRRQFAEFDVALLTLDNAEWPLHLHAPASMALVYRGVWWDSAAGEPGERRVEAGNVLFRPAALEHSNRVREATEILFVELAPSIVRAYCPLYGNVARSIELPFAAVDGVADRLRAAIRGDDPVQQMLIDGLIRQMLAIGARAPEGRTPEWLRQLLQHIDEHLSDPLSLEELSAAAAISVSRLTHGFRAAVGVSPGEYIRKQRVRLAARQLRTTDNAIRDIALEAGFCDQAHLTRHFKTQRGVTPAQYRRLRRNRN